MAVVQVTYHHEDDAWWAESDDMPGFSAVGNRFDEVRQLVREAAPQYFGDVTPEFVDRLDSGAAIVEAAFAAMIPGAGLAVVSHASTYALPPSHSIPHVSPFSAPRATGDTAVTR